MTTFKEEVLSYLGYNKTIDEGLFDAIKNKIEQNKNKKIVAKGDEALKQANELKSQITQQMNDLQNYAKQYGADQRTQQMWRQCQSQLADVNMKIQEVQNTSAVAKAATDGNEEAKKSMQLTRNVNNSVNQMNKTTQKFDQSMNQMMQKFNQNPNVNFRY